MKRRDFLVSAGVTAGGLILPGAARALTPQQRVVLFGGHNLLARGLAPLGDSRSANIQYDGTGPALGIQNETQNHLNQAKALNTQNFFYTGRFALAGATSTTIVANYLSGAVASRAKFITILMGVNDPGQSITTATTFANIQTAVNAALAKGMTPIVFTDPGATNFTTAQCTAFHGTGGLNDQIRALASSRVKVYDMASFVLATTNPIAFNTTGGVSWSYDGTHLSTLGAAQVGKDFGNFLTSNGIIPVGSAPSLSGSTLANGNFGTTTGGTVGTGNTGTMPASWTGTAAAASTTTAFSTNVRGDGVTELVAAFSSTSASAAQARISQNPSASGIGAGNIVQGGVQVDIDSTYSHFAFAFVEVDLNYVDSTFSQGYDNRNSASTTADIVLPAGTISLTLMTQPITVPAGETVNSINFRMGANGNANAGFTARFRNPWFKKIG